MYSAHDQPENPDHNARQKSCLNSPPPPLPGAPPPAGIDCFSSNLCHLYIVHHSCRPIDVYAAVRRETAETRLVKACAALLFKMRRFSLRSRRWRYQSFWHFILRRPLAFLGGEIIWSRIQAQLPPPPPRARALPPCVVCFPCVIDRPCHRS